jgi:hypothetical protein
VLSNNRRLKKRHCSIVLVNRKLFLRACENRALRRNSGPKRDEMVVDWRRLQSEELYNLYAS